ncbi:hypothetical protein UT300005_03680 [Clostridium sp. CTA-5]
MNNTKIEKEKDDKDMGLQFAKSNGLLGEIANFYIPNEQRKSGVCKGATDLCKKYCYGNSVFSLSENEEDYFQTDRIALENYEISLTDEFEELMCELLKTIRQKIVRIHSIGEFYCYEYFCKWIRIMKRNPEIQFVAYIKAFDILKTHKDLGKEVPNNFHVVLSIYPDTYDHYSKMGGKEYVEELLRELGDYYHAKRYVVCSKEYFKQEINKEETNKFFCNGGTNILLGKPGKKKSENYNEKLEKYEEQRKKYIDLFDPEKSCAECMKCYSNDIVKEGDTIYALLRATSKLANLNTFLHDSNPDEYKELRKMFPDEM